jgi:3-hydroxyacyl-[acyl-carrier-protein] dehydratase
MRIENQYYLLKSLQAEEDGTTLFHLALKPDCDVYRGHFPGHPVCPGVLNIQMIKECAERMMDRPARLSHIRQCRLTAVATPEVCPELDLRITLASTSDTCRTLTATLFDSQRTYLELKGELTV